MSSAFPYKLLLAVALLFALDAALFRTGWRHSFIEPQSYAGQAELMIQRASHAPTGRSVLVMGDSRIAEGFSARLAAHAADGRLGFVNGAVSGSTLRCWHYLLREADPAANRFQAIVLPFDDYRDEDGIEDWADRILDLSIVIDCLRLSDIWPFSRSVPDWSQRFEALRGGTFKGFVLKDDLQAFLAHPWQRIEKARQWRENGAAWIDGYDGHPGDLTTATPPHPRSMTPQNGRYAAYRRHWLGRILDRYRNSRTSIWVIRVPRTPFPDRQPAPPPSSVVQELRSPVLHVAAEGAFLWLERPEFFFDPLHLNSKGRAEFSEALAALPF